MTRLNRERGPEAAPMIDRGAIRPLEAKKVCETLSPKRAKRREWMEILSGRTYLAIAKPFDRWGNPAAPPGPVAWSVEPPGALVLTARPDGSALIGGGIVGKSRLTAKSGSVSGSLEVSVVAGPAASLEIAIDPFDPTGSRGR